MMKIGILLPEANMIGPAERIAGEIGIEIACLKAIHTVDAVNEARLAVEAGAHIIVGRGYQAKLIRQYTNVPVVEMRFHSQEIGLLLKKAQAMVKKKHPRIVLIVFENMIADLSHMGELFDVDLEIAYLDDIENADAVIRKKAGKQIDLVIGGEATCRTAEKMGYPTLFYQSTDESLKEALLSAKEMAMLAETEKMNVAQFETVLDTSFNGIIKVNTEGKIIVINKMMENLLGRSQEEVVGLLLTRVIPQMDGEILQRILEGRTESYSTSLNLKNKAWMILIAPIQYDHMITGAILSVHKITETVHERKDPENAMVLHGFSALTTFRDIPTKNRRMKEILEEAKTFALSERPVVIYGQAGTEDYLVAEAIHNNSSRRSGPYVSINIRGLDREEQMAALFQREAADTISAYGAKGAMIKANRGTLFIKGLEHLTMRAQHQLLRTMLSQAMMRTDAQPIDALNVRIIGSSRTNLKHLVQKGEFSEELYYFLQGLVIELPGLNERPEDLKHCFDTELKHYKEKYNRHLSVSAGAYEKLQELTWNGNMFQVKAFCERLVLSARKRVIDEVAVERLFTELYPYVGDVNGAEKVVVYKSPEGAKLSALLEKHHGNRKLAAEELGISTTTLWRRMKKYGVVMDYHD